MTTKYSLVIPTFNEAGNIHPLFDEIKAVMSEIKLPWEVIFVNDGSTDDTLKRLIENYQLERVEQVIDDKLSTMPVLGIYKSKSLPNLTVIDKINGGKADSLNGL